MNNNENDEGDDKKRVEVARRGGGRLFLGRLACDECDGDEFGGTLWGLLIFFILVMYVCVYVDVALKKTPLQTLVISQSSKLKLNLRSFSENTRAEKRSHCDL